MVRAFQCSATEWRWLLEEPRSLARHFLNWEITYMIKELNKDTLFKPNLSRMEAQKAATDKTAKAILSQEKTVKDAKTQRLKAARIARDQTA
jgi:hypothetical protein